MLPLSTTPNTEINPCLYTDNADRVQVGLGGEKEQRESF